MEKEFLQKKEFIFMISVFMIILLSVGVYAINNDNEGYALSKGEKLIKGFRFTSTIAKTFFVPTASDSEWTAFLANLPSGITKCTPVAGKWTDKEIVKECDADTPACGETTTGREYWERTCEDAKCGGGCIGASSGSDSCTKTGDVCYTYNWDDDCNSDCDLGNIVCRRQPGGEVVLDSSLCTKPKPTTCEEGEGDCKYSYSWDSDCNSDCDLGNIVCRRQPGGEVVLDSSLCTKPKPTTCEEGEGDCKYSYSWNFDNCGDGCNTGIKCLRDNGDFVGDEFCSEPKPNWCEDKKGDCEYIYRWYAHCNEGCEWENIQCGRKATKLNSPIIKIDDSVCHGLDYLIYPTTCSAGTGDCHAYSWDYASNECGSNCQWIGKVNCIDEDRNTANDENCAQSVGSPITDCTGDFCLCSTVGEYTCDATHGLSGKCCGGLECKRISNILGGYDYYCGTPEATVEIPEGTTEFTEGETTCTAVDGYWTYTGETECFSGDCPLSNGCGDVAGKKTEYRSYTEPVCGGKDVEGKEETVVDCPKNCGSCTGTCGNDNICYPALKCGDDLTCSGDTPICREWWSVWIWGNKYACVQCKTKEDCNSGEVCQSYKCEPEPSCVLPTKNEVCGSRECGTIPKTACGEKKTYNCGSCSSGSCSNGKCIDDGCVVSCKGSIGTCCDSTLTCSNGACVSLGGL